MYISQESHIRIVDYLERYAFDLLFHVDFFSIESDDI